MRQRALLRVFGWAGRPEGRPLQCWRTHAKFRGVPAYRKRLRLPARDYVGRRTYFVTVCTENRAAFFSDIVVGRWLLEELIATSSRASFTLHAYCVMPDHVHFVPEALADTCDLVRFVDGFKQRTAYEFSERQGMRLWQRRYYDHVLRTGERIEDVACYVWWNPVRKKLCAEPCQFLLSGSQTIDWMKQSVTAPRWQPPWKLKGSGFPV
jgi:putative transposase